MKSQEGSMGSWGLGMENVWKKRVTKSLSNNTLVRMWPWTVGTNADTAPSQGEVRMRADPTEGVVREVVLC